MEAIEILNNWKSQGTRMEQAFTATSLKHIFNQKSQGVLTGIRRILKLECLVLIFFLVLANCLFMIVQIPFSKLRWVCFILFNIFLLLNIIRYLVTIHKLKLDFTENLLQSLQTITKTLITFKNLNWLFRFPFVVIIFCMFGLMQLQVSLVPWLIAEFFIWRWLLSPYFTRRFHRYVDELDLSRRVLMEV